MIWKMHVIILKLHVAYFTLHKGVFHERQKQTGSEMKGLILIRLRKENKHENNIEVGK